MDRTHSFGYWLRRRRKALDLTQAELAQRASCSLELIQKIEADARRPSRQMAEKLADVLGIDTLERAAFIQAARAERAVDQLDMATQPVGQPQRSPHTNLPAQLTPLIGREKEVATISSLLRRADVRLVTLTGPGGIGKTRLSLQVASELLDDFAHGMYFVDLAPIREPNLVIGQIATTLGVKEVGAQPLLATLKAYLRDKHILLLLDNFEQVVDAAPLVSELLESAAHLNVLVTSREVLKLRGEKEFAVPPLALPDSTQLPAVEQLSKYAAVALFIQRALDSRPDFELTNANAPAVAEICARLDGLPLAIELAAARLKLFSPEALLVRLSSRLTLLSGGPRDLPARQQTIRNTIAWSYDLLNEGEQTLFRRLGVFVGGCTLEAAEAVTKLEGSALAYSNVLDALEALLDKSLVHQKENGDTSRFTMLETIREYALERLEASGEAELLRKQHAFYYLAYGDEQWSISDSATYLAWETRYLSEYTNFLAALNWCQTTSADTDFALRLANAMSTLWYYRGMWHEAIAAFEQSLTNPRVLGCTSNHAYARIELGQFYGFTAQYEQARSQYEQALQLMRELADADTDYQKEVARVLERLGWIARERGDSVAAWNYLSEALAIFRVVGETNPIVIALNTMAGVAILEEDPTRAESLLLESKALWPSDSLHSESIGWTLNHLGQVAQLRDEYEQAMQLHEKSLAYFVADHHVGRDWAYQSLGECHLGLGQPTEARRWLRQALEISQTVNGQASIAWCLARLGCAAALDEEPERAVRLWGAAERLRQSLGCRPAPATRATYERAMTQARAQLGEEAFAVAWAEGRALTVEQAIAEAVDDAAPIT